MSAAGMSGSFFDPVDVSRANKTASPRPIGSIDDVSPAQSSASAALKVGITP